MYIAKTILLFLLFLGISYYAFVYRMKSMLSLRGKINRLIFCGLFSMGVAIIGAYGSDPIMKDSKEQAVQKKNYSTEKVQEIPYIKLDVPLIDQMEDPQLYNGCEVTSLAMLLNYYGMDVSKIELADQIKKVSYQEDEGIYGDPNEGFVGDITGVEKGYGVYVGPIVELAKKQVSSQYEVKDLSKKSFTAILDQLALGTPIWCITTVPMTATDDMETWQTSNGEVEISWNIHSVVLTGFDKEKVFVNDPYGEKTEVSTDDFRRSWEQMGSQAMTIQYKID